MTQKSPNQILSSFEAQQPPMPKDPSRTSMFETWLRQRNVMPGFGFLASRGEGYGGGNNRQDIRQGTLGRNVTLPPLQLPPVSSTPPIEEQGPPDEDPPDENVPPPDSEGAESEELPPGSISGSRGPPDRRYNCYSFPPPWWCERREEEEEEDSESSSGGSGSSESVSVSSFPSGSGSSLELATGPAPAGFGVTLDNALLQVETAVWADVHIPMDMTITAVKMFAEPAGSIQVDIWKAPEASFPPTDSDSITGGTVPAIVSDVKSSDEVLSGWTRKVDAHDCVRFYVDSVTDVQTCHISVEGHQGTIGAFSSGFDAGFF